MRYDRLRAEQSKTDDHRSPAQHDRDRIVYSSLFRRLAGVTQVVSPDHGHVFHNRLTHTIKVAQLARRLAERVLTRHAPVAHAHQLDVEVAEAAALAHDLGHAPFGHLGESELDASIRRRLGHEAEGFEGNAQTFRILARLAVRDQDGAGLNLTRATLNATLKYPWFYDPTDPKRRKKWSAYSDDAEAFRFARASASGDARSLEAEIMDWSDDIAYSIHDVEDFYRAGLVPIDRILESTREREQFFSFCWDHATPYDGLRNAGEIDQAWMGISDQTPDDLRDPYEGTTAQRGALRLWTSILVGRFVRAATAVAPGPTPALEVNRTQRVEVYVLKSLMKYYVFQNPALRGVQWGQRRVVSELFDLFANALEQKDEGRGRVPREIVPVAEREQYIEAEKVSPARSSTLAARFAADAVASLTEAQAIALHARLTGQRSGFVWDPIAH
jgi:dGTPase